MLYSYVVLSLFYLTPYLRAPGLCILKISRISLNIPPVKLISPLLHFAVITFIKGFFVLQTNRKDHEMLFLYRHTIFPSLRRPGHYKWKCSGNMGVQNILGQWPSGSLNHDYDKANNSMDEDCS